MPPVTDLNLALSEDRILHAVVGGVKDPLLLLVHGADRRFQNARYWAPHYDWLARQGRFLAVDLLGHGGSRPGEADPLSNPVSVPDQVAALAALLRQETDAQRPAIAFGRSYGGRLVLELTRAHPELIRALVLIAPSVTSDFVDRLPPAVTSKPALIIWAADDPIIPPARYCEPLRRTFPAARFHGMGRLRPLAAEQWRAHTPEIERPQQFQAAVSEFLHCS